jgi:secreted trypsin-like serine protease
MKISFNLMLLAAFVFAIVYTGAFGQENPSPAIPKTMRPIVKLAMQGGSADLSMATSREYLASGALFEQYGSSMRFACSGTLIGPRTFLTAAHCVTNNDGYYIEKLARVVFFQFSGWYEVDEKIFIKSDYAGVYNNDIAILTLRKPVDGIMPVDRSVATSSLEDSGIIIGFGNPVSNVPKSAVEAYGSGIKRYASAVVSSCYFSKIEFNKVTSNTSFIYHNVLCAEGDSQVAPTARTCPGDSGGGFYKDGKIVGVTSFGLEGVCLGSKSVFSEVFAHTAWIDRAMPSVDPKQLCGGFQCLTESAFLIRETDYVIFADKPTRVFQFEAQANIDRIIVTVNAPTKDYVDQTKDVELLVGLSRDPGGAHFAPPEICKGFGNFLACDLDSRREDLEGVWYVFVQAARGNTQFQITAAGLSAKPN